MIAVDRSAAAPLDLTDENANGTRSDLRPVSLATVLPMGVAEPVSVDELAIAELEDEVDELLTENDSLKASLRRLLAIVDKQAVDRAALSELVLRLTRAEETIEDLVAITVSTRPYGPVR